MPALKEGDTVEVVRREATDDEVKSSRYFPHFGGLAGRVLKIYSPEEAAVDVLLPSLPRPLRQRHEDIRSQMKTKWLDGLSEEGRNRLTEREKDFVLRYVILVNTKDLKPAAVQPDILVEEAPAVAETPQPARKTLAQIEADEVAELKRVAAAMHVDQLSLMEEE